MTEKPWKRERLATKRAASVGLPRPGADARRLFVVGFGNNGMLVERLLRQRPWMHPFGEFSRATGKEVSRVSTPQV